MGLPATHKTVTKEDRGAKDCNMSSTGGVILHKNAKKSKKKSLLQSLQKVESLVILSATFAATKNFETSCCVLVNYTYIFLQEGFKMYWFKYVLVLSLYRMHIYIYIAMATLQFDC